MGEKMAALFRQISHGVYVIGVTDGERRNAFTAAWVMQASFSPLMLVFSINPEHYSYRLLQAGGVCSVNVLEKSQLAMAEHFGRSGLRDKMAVGQWQKGKTGAPLLLDALACFDCRVSHYCQAGDHQLVVCSVADAVPGKPGEPMLYRDTGNMDGSAKMYPDTL